MDKTRDIGKTTDAVENIEKGAKIADAAHGIEKSILKVELSELPENVQKAFKGYSKNNPSWSGNYKE